jgi:putative heme-binding domain-containing protein
LTPEFLKTASRSQGRVMFKTLCGTCQTLFGEGQKIGPDLTGSNRADLDYILENVTNPNALIGKDYELHLFALKDGRVVSGLVRKETDSAFTVQTLTSEDVVAKADIKEHTLPGISMMPIGQFTALSKEQVRDLIAYLASPVQVAMPGEGPEDKTMRVAGAIEGESMKILARAGAPQPQDMKPFPDSRWSGDEQLWWTGAKPGDQLVLELPIAQPGRYQVQAVLTRAPDYGVVRFRLDGELLSDKQIDLFGWNVTTTPLLTLGERELTAGVHRFTLEITGANPEAVKSYMIGLDYLWLKRL